MRLIDADKLYPDRMTKDGLAISQSQIANAPTVEPKQGKWVVHDRPSLKYGCNICGNLTNINSNFCPNCGSDNRITKVNTYKTILMNDPRTE